MNKQKKEEIRSQIQLELPDYSHAYEEWIRKNQKQSIEEETVIIIENY